MTARDWRDSPRLTVVLLALLLALLLPVIRADAQGSPPCLGDIWDMQVYIHNPFVGCGNQVYRQTAAGWKLELTLTSAQQRRFAHLNGNLRIPGVAQTSTWYEQFILYWNRMPTYGTSGTQMLLSYDKGRTWSAYTPDRPRDGLVPNPQFVMGFILNSLLINSGHGALTVVFENQGVHVLIWKYHRYIRLRAPAGSLSPVVYRDKLYYIDPQGFAAYVGEDDQPHALDISHCPYPRDVAGFLTGVYVLCNQLLTDGRWRISAHMDCGYQDWLEVDVQYQTQPATVFVLSESGEGMVIHYALGDNVIRRQLPYFAACRV